MFVVMAVSLILTKKATIKGNGCFQKFLKVKKVRHQKMNLMLHYLFIIKRLLHITENIPSSCRKTPYRGHRAEV
jgi:hypothetical protein